MFSSKFCEIVKNTTFTEHLWATTCKKYLHCNYLQKFGNCLIVHKENPLKNKERQVVPWLYLHGCTQTPLLKRLYLPNTSKRSTCRSLTLLLGQQLFYTVVIMGVTCRLLNLEYFVRSLWQIVL